MNSNNVRPIAHVARNSDGSWREPHDLTEHLRSVASLAASFARDFGENWARMAGLWHDLGKYRPRFQDYIRQSSGFEVDAHVKGGGGKAPHSTAGALLACDKFGETGRILAYLIAGHHAGLYDWNSENSSLQHRLGQEDSRAELNEVLAAQPPSAVLESGEFEPDMRAIPGGKDGFALWVRMLFSCLVDADFLDTEAYMNPDKSVRRGQWSDIPTLLEAFDSYMDTFSSTASSTPVNRLRADILAQCRARAADVPGLFSLTVPTGGGKTLSSMAFALEHAKRYGKQRVIYVIPYTSIIEQTADIYRSIFGDAVIEHHSNAESEPGKENYKSRLACENWDAPIVVTTNVQFFESLFASRTSRCRKLHNIVNSVVVLDEAQLLPPESLQPVLDTLNRLAGHYGVTAVLSTATQPALSTREYFDASKNLHGLNNVREIVSDPDALYRKLRRVDVHLPDDLNIPTSWEVLACDISKHDSVLTIVNTRKHARELYRLMPEGTLHLSALMCGAHRSQVIGEIKSRLNNGQSTRVVSTQLVEAGVDVDFPVVYRALAGLDSIAQAAGRCNREGRLNAEGKLGEVTVFVPPQPAPPGLLRKGENACKSVLHGHIEEPLDRMLFDRYFEKFYYDCELDAEGVCDLLRVDGNTLAVNFRTAAERFRLIKDDDSVPVVVLYRGPDNNDTTINTLLGRLRKEGPQRLLMRKLQRYIVNVRQRDVFRLRERGDIEEVFPGLFVQSSDRAYNLDVGLCVHEISINTNGWIV